MMDNIKEREYGTLFHMFGDPNLDFWYSAAIVGIGLSILGHVALIFFVWFS